MRPGVQGALDIKLGRTAQAPAFQHGAGICLQQGLPFYRLIPALAPLLPPQRPDAALPVAKGRGEHRNHDVLQASSSCSLWVRGCVDEAVGTADLQCMGYQGLASNWPAWQKKYILSVDILPQHYTAHKQCQHFQSNILTVKPVNRER